MQFTPALSEVVLHAPAQHGWLYFQRPEEIIAVFRYEDVPAALGEIEHQVNQRNRFAAGFLAYEAAPAFERAFQVKMGGQADFPLLWFGIYPQPAWLPDNAIEGVGAVITGPWLPDIEEHHYCQAIQRIKDHIACGETYQVNFTYRLHAACQTPAWPIFSSLANAHRAPFAAFLETEAWAICSISPEMFFSLEGATLTSRPMKGTAPRGRTLEEDRQQADWLYNSEKNRAENVMILDMVRNDMGRIAHTGSVQVPELFKIEKYSTVWQMTSTVQAETEAGLCEIMQSLFPAASITGAPKIRTMQLINGLESSRRGIYTGAIGYFAPGRKAQFNVAIRTIHIDKLRQEAEYGVGGGIVWDSEEDMEWEETIDKARILFERPQPFELLETMRWTPAEGWFLLEQHLERLKNSAAYFSYPIQIPAIREELDRIQEGFKGFPQLIRLKLAWDGAYSLEHQPLPQRANPACVGIAKSPVHSSDRFLYHKTTRREMYQKALAECPGYDEVLLWNERGEVTEGCIANVVVELDGELFTPPVESGLLPGTYRAWLLDQKLVCEKVILLNDLRQCSRIFLVNSVRGMWEVKVG